MDLLNTVIQWILVCGLYALFATGLSLIFGVMQMVNIAHGDLIVLAAYVAKVVVNAIDLHPLLALNGVVPLMGGFGYLLQRGILKRTLGKDLLPPLLVSFGLSVIVQNGLLETFTADSQKLTAGALETASFTIAGISVGYLPLLMFATAVAVIAGLQFLFYRTALGRAFRATSDDAEIAGLMGLDRARVYGWAMALCLGVVAIAGVFLAIRSNFDSFMGPGRPGICITCGFAWILGYSKPRYSFSSFLAFWGTLAPRLTIWCS